jgi:flagellar hook assembly protein FlgD
MVIGTQLRSGDFVLFQNFPNPFNPETWIPYKLDVTADVEIRIYNVNGQLIRNLILGKQVPGTYLIKGKAAYWNGLNNYGEQVSSGIYFYQFLANDKKSDLKKMVILR